SVSVPGCGSDECVRYSERCNGDHVETCEPPCGEPGCGTKWGSGQQCMPGDCVEIDPNNAVCVLSLKPDAHCSDADGHCDGNIAVVCFHGYQISRKDCTLPQASTPISTDGAADSASETQIDGSAAAASKGGHCATDTPIIYNGVGRLSAYCYYNTP